MTDLLSIAGKSALITGGSRGVGLMIARGFVEAGVTVYIAARDAQACERTAKELSGHGVCHALPADLSRDAECRRLAAELTAVQPELDILVNNAGATYGGSLDDFDDAAWDQVLDLNVKGVFHLTRHLRRALEAAGTEEDPARVINIGSIDGLHVPPMETYSYAASKAAMHHMTRHLAKRLGPRITVNALALGAFESDMMANSLGTEMTAHAPLRRLGRPDDIVGVTTFLASRGAAYLTGVVLPVDGGLTTTG
ncbi:SDR family oxidoreductase [Streptomyces sp. NPDC050211]|uniref:SDR family oxidoreductase n=1 Tax=Streptomyces sp. NPDC050211 TaxID=3154932 RepID=UPI00341E7239